MVDPLSPVGCEVEPSWIGLPHTSLMGLRFGARSTLSALCCVPLTIPKKFSWSCLEERWAAAIRERHCHDVVNLVFNGVWVFGFYPYDFKTHITLKPDD